MSSNTIRIHVQLGCVFLLCVGSSYARAYTIIDNGNGIAQPMSELFSVGEPINSADTEQYWAQTFTTPAVDNRIQSLQFRLRNSTSSPYLGHAVDGDLPFRVLLTEVEFDASEFHPGTILFESSSLVVLHTTTSTLQSFQVSFPDIVLSPLTQYAFVLDTFTDANYTDGNFPRAITPANPYDAGAIYSRRSPLDSNGMPTGTRASHFSGQWSYFTPEQNVDMSFAVTFVPEPSTFALALTALLATLGIARARRTRQDS